MIVPFGKETNNQMLKDKKNEKQILGTDGNGCGKPRIVDNSTIAGIIVHQHKEVEHLVKNE